MFRTLISILGSSAKIQLGLIMVMIGFGSLLELVGFSLIVAVIAAMADPASFLNHPFILGVYKVFGFYDESSFTAPIILVVIVVYFFRAIYLIAQYYVLMRFVRTRRHQLSAMLMEATLERPYQYFVSHSSSEIQRNLINDTNQFAAYLSSTLQLTAEAFVVIVLAVFLLLVSPLMSLACLCVIGILLLLSRLIIEQRVTAAGKMRRERDAERMRWLSQSIRGIKAIKIAQKEMYFTSNYRRTDRDFARSEYIQSLWQKSPSYIVETTVIIAALIYLLIAMINHNDLTTLLPELSAFVLAATRLLPACNRINSHYTTIAYNRAAVQKIEDEIQELKTNGSLASNSDIDGRKKKPAENINLFENTRGDVLLAQTTNSAPHQSYYRDIALKDITFCYEGEKKPVLKNVNLDIPSGSTVGIIGPSGAGKTTLIDIMLGLLSPDLGSVTYGGINIKDIYYDYLHRIAYLPQEAFIIDGTIRENVALGINPQMIDESQVWRSLEQASLKDFVLALPRGLDTKVGEAGIRLSGGERQRLGIARALYNQCDVLVLDEATSALDSHTAENVLATLDSLKGTRTFVIVAHQVNALAYCDRIYRLENGVISGIIDDSNELSVSDV